MRVLIIEDDAELRGAVARRLRAVGYAADEATDLTDGDELQAVSDYDLVILDRMLPDGDAFEQLAGWRRAGVETPVILVTGSTSVEDRVEGLSTGADDYLTKPFAMAELLARVAALTRRATPPLPAQVRVGDLVIDSARREVRRAGTLLPLRPKEYSVLHLLASRKGVVVSRADIIEHCWDMNYEPSSNVEESVVASLRRKLGKPELIRTARGSGYVLEDPV